MQRPNILLLYTDQQRWDALGANNNPEIKYVFGEPRHGWYRQTGALGIVSLGGRSNDRAGWDGWGGGIGAVVKAAGIGVEG